MNISRLAAFLRRKPKKAVRLELRYESVSGDFNKLQSWDLAELDEFGPDAVLSAAQDDCNGRRQRCRYEATWVDSDGESLAVRAMRCKPERDEEDDEDEEEEPQGLVDTRHEPTIAGVLAQHMRFVETDRKLNNVATANAFKYYAEALRESREENRQLREENRKLQQRLRARDEPETGDTVESQARADALNKLVDIGLPLLAQHLQNSAGPRAH